MAFSSFLLAVAVLFGIVDAEVFYNIAHGTNTVTAVDWAIEQGANAVEIDLEYTGSGQLKQFRHGLFCDCTCRCPVPFTRRCLRNPQFSCFPLRQEFLLPCYAISQVDELLQHIATKSEIALVYIDSKLDDGDDLDVAGSRLIQAVENLLFSKGYGGNLIIGAFSSDHYLFLQSAAFRWISSPYKNKMYFAYEDGTLNEFPSSVSVLQTLGVPQLDIPPPNYIFGTGSSSCIDLENDQSTLELAAINKARGSISMAYTWTVDCINCIESDLDYVHGIITNYPSRVLNVLQRTGRQLATQASVIPGYTTLDLVVDPAPYSCQCDFREVGCFISVSSPQGLACKCEVSSRSPPRCSGKVVLCRNSQSPNCQTPDTSLDSCEQGGGNCDGYIP